MSAHPLRRQIFSHFMKGPLMPVEPTSAAGSIAVVKTLLKILGVPLLAGAVATTLGFLFMWPRTMREAAIRMASTLMMSMVCGPAVVIAAAHWMPGAFDTARTVAVLYGLEPVYGQLLLAAPFLVLAGLPAWWVIGWLVRWMDKRKDKDIAQVASDAAAAVRELRGVQ